MAQTRRQVSGGAQERALSVIPHAIHTALKARRREQKDLARYIGISETQLSERIHARTPFKAHEVAGAAEFLGVSPGFLYTDPAQWVPAEQSLNVHEFDSQASLLLPSGEPAFNFGRTAAGFVLAS